MWVVYSGRIMVRKASDCDIRCLSSVAGKLQEAARTWTGGEWAKLRAGAIYRCIVKNDESSVSHFIVCSLRCYLHVQAHPSHSESAIVVVNFAEDGRVAKPDLAYIFCLEAVILFLIAMHFDLNFDCNQNLCSARTRQ